ncbi:MAG: hypothetical protein ACD_22C00022G0004 [uncultured bacterium]|nr:MAG: hypothetical protein ACD_22C00022G0004 [uncultured bacterium]
MIILLIALAIYLALGFVYALYILLFGYDRWFAFPINMLLGPVFIVYIIYITKTGKKLPL